MTKNNIVRCSINIVISPSYHFILRVSCLGNFVTEPLYIFVCTMYSSTYNIRRLRGGICEY